MSKNSQKLLLILLSFLIIEIFSFLGSLFPLVNQIFFLILVFATLALSLYHLEYGLLVVFAELFIGSMGHLFYFTVGAYELPIRIALWLVVMVVFGGKLIQQLIKGKSSSRYWISLKGFSAWKIIGGLFLFIIIGIINGLGRHNDLNTIFLDFNSWLYFLLILPAVIVYGCREEPVITRLQSVFLAGALWLSIKTLFLLFIFTHNNALTADIYLWLRQTIVGEVTPTITGWPRIFIQGQSFSAIAFFLFFWFKAANFKFGEFFKRQNLFMLVAAAAFLSTILLSFSRSFWVGLLGTLIFSFILIWRRRGFKKMLTAGVWVLSAGALSIALIYLVAAWPYWQVKSTDFSQSFLARTGSGNDAAVASRWSLLPILTQAVLREPIFGQGFGSVVTYVSRDPRILQRNPSGQYTTSSFEWGYLSLWLKIGLAGLAVYLLFLGLLIRDSLRLAAKTNNYLFYALPAGILFLALTHTFTPYLNHPLGIGFLVISSCLIWPNRVY
ncbi:MAG: O-antigen ligase family protein [Patescibacteria group bacterium]|jgi:hypothetical protein